jgi:hypothetical protein
MKAVIIVLAAMLTVETVAQSPTTQVAASSSQLSREPGARQPPVPHHSLRRHVQYVGRFLNRQPSKEAQLDHLRAPRINLRERLQRIVERAEFTSALGFVKGEPIQVHGRLVVDTHSGAPLCRGARASRFHQNPSHDSRRHGKQVVPVLPVNRLGISEAHICLVNERRGLERMAAALATHVVMRETSQFVVDERRQPLERGFVPATPGL